VNSFVPNRGGEPLLMTYYLNVYLCVSLTILMNVTDVLQAESCISNFCLPLAFFSSICNTFVRQTLSAVMYRSFGNETNGSKA